MPDARSVQILTVENSTFTFALEGPLPNRAAYPNRRFPQVVQTNGPWPIEYRTASSDSITILAAGGAEPSLVTVNPNLSAEFGSALVYETIEYRFTLTTKSGAPVIVRSGRDSLPRQFTSQDKYGGVLRFDNSAGLSHVTFSAHDGSELLQLTIFVGTLKVDYFTERRAILDVLHRAHTALSIRAMSPTYAHASITYGSATDAQFADIIERRGRKLIRDVGRIEAASLKARVPVKGRLRPDRMKRVPGQVRNQIDRFGLQHVINERVTTDVRVATHDSLENRHVKRSIAQIERTATQWISRHGKSAAGKSKMQLMEVIHYARRSLHTTLENPFWQQVSRSRPAARGRATYHADYLALEREIARIRRALIIDDRGRTEIGQASMAALYEAWVYVRLAAMLATLQGADESAQFEVSSTAFENRLFGGEQAALEIGNIVLTAQRRISTEQSGDFFSPITEQRPDVFVQSLANDRAVVIDAKYRVSVWDNRLARRLSNSEIVALPFDPAHMTVQTNLDDIETAHRYRDAIRRPSAKTITALAGSYIVNPVLQESHSWAGTLVQTALQYEVGALPMVPGSPDDEISVGFVAQTGTEQIRAIAAVLNRVL